MYRYNPSAKYSSNRGRWNATVKDLEKLDIFVNDHQNFHIVFPNIFVQLQLPYFSSKSEEFHRWGYGDYMTFWQSQLFFAVHCATTALGISVQMLNDESTPHMVHSILKFHCYYHIRRVLFRLGVALPYEDRFNISNNNYSKGAFANLCAEYGADPKGPYKFESMNNAFFKPSNMFFPVDNGDYAKWIIPTSIGFTSQGLIKISESIRLYVELLLNSQVSGIASIIGNGVNNRTVRQIYLSKFEGVVKRSENVPNDLTRFQSFLKHANTPVNFVIFPQCYMTPSDMNLHVGKIENYNNKIVIASKSAKVGSISTVNAVTKSIAKHPSLPSSIHEVQSHPLAKHEERHPLAKHEEHARKLPKHEEHARKLPKHEVAAAEAHEDAKIAIVTLGVGAILLAWYWF